MTFVLIALTILVVIAAGFISSFMKLRFSNTLKNDANVAFTTASFANEGEMLRDDFITQVTEPFILCTCFPGFDYSSCKRTLKDYTKEPTRRQVIEVVSAWYRESQSLDKTIILRALKCLRNGSVAKHFEERHK